PLAPSLFFLSFDIYRDHRHLHSFPTRRSSDLRAGVSRGAQTHHFPTKALLVAASIQHLFDIEAERFRAAFTELPRAQRDLASAVDRKSTRLNSSHVKISYAVFCLKKKNTETKQ